jgi:chromosome segregation ATPase
MTAAEWGNWFVATPNERLAFSGDEIAALVRDLAACERERDEWKASYQTEHQTSQQLAEELTKQDAERDALKARLAEARWIIDQSVQEYVFIPEYQQRRDAWLKEVTGEPT